MNSNKKDKSKSLQAPFKKLYKKLTSRSSSPAPDERSDGNSSTNHLQQNNGQTATEGQVVPLALVAALTSAAVEEAVNKEGTGDSGIGGNSGEDGPSAGEGHTGPVITITGAQDFAETLLKEGVNRKKERTKDGGGLPMEEPSTVQRVGALAYEGLKESLRLVIRCTDAVPVVKSATQGVLEIFERYDAVTGIPGELTDLKDKLQALASILEKNDLLSISNRLGGLARTFEEKARIIGAKLERNLSSRIIESTDDVQFLSREIRAITFAIEIVMMDVNLKTHTMVLELHHIALLDKLKYVEGAGFNHEDRQGCANGTRMLLLADLLTWATERKGKPIFWLNGMAGTGKTAVTETFCNLLAGKGILGSSFFCSRKTADRRKVNLIIPSLASALAYKYPEFQEELIQVLQNCLDPTGMDLEKQFKTLLIEPARIAFAKHSGSITLAIDALDECEDQQAAEMFLKIILKEKSAGVLRFFITSRPETKIRKGFSAGVYAGVRLQDIEAHIVKADIRVYLLAAFEEIDDLQSEYDGQWPPAELDTIVENSGNLFIYAATGVKYISDERGDPIDCLRKYASITPPSNAIEAIDKVYLFVLKETFYQLDADEQQRVQLCLQTVVCAMEPLSVVMYSVLLRMSALQVRRAFAALHSVVQMPEDKKDDQNIVLYHASFPDYLTSASRTNSAPWYINVSSAHVMLLDQCLRIMTSKLYFNVVKALTSYESNYDQGLQVAPELEYTCGFWPDHLFKTVSHVNLIPDAIAIKIEQFLLEKFLYWLEVLSATDKVQYAAASLSHIYRITVSPALKNMCRDFAAFTSKYLAAIKFSAPHIYLSALPWVAPNSILGLNFLSKFSHLPKIMDSKVADDWEPLHSIQLSGHTNAVTCIAYSPDGKYLASGSYDKSIRIWNTETGQHMLQISTQTSDEGSFKFSSTMYFTRLLTYLSNGKYIVVGSDNDTVQMWDSNTGELKFTLYLGHTQTVMPIAISPNEKFIASLSFGSIILHDLQTREKIHTFYRSDINWYMSLAFSPDSTFLASGGDECCISVWNIQTGDIVSKLQKNKEENGFVHSITFTSDGQSVLCALSNHLKIWDLWSGQDEQTFSPQLKLQGVTSAAFSPNGAYIVSNSGDNTVRVWNTETRKELVPALYGHSDTITSVVFAPDGNSVASGSADCTINIWHISEALNLSEKVIDNTVSSLPLKHPEMNSHQGYIKSVAFSPDGQFIASACTDQLVGVWHVDTGMPKFSLLRGHKSDVNTVAWSPDNMLIASGSNDNTIILWNANTGALDEILQGHAASVTSVAISPDGKNLVSGSLDTTIRIWSLETRTQVLCIQGHSYGVSSVAYSADGGLIVSSCNPVNTIGAWNATTGAEITSPLKGKKAVFTPDGNYLISASGIHSCISIWDVHANFQKLKVINNPDCQGLRCFAVTPNSKSILCASENRIVFIDIETENSEAFLHGHNQDILSVAVSPDGKYIVSGGRDAHIRIWNFPALSSSVNPSTSGLFQYYSPQLYLYHNGWYTCSHTQDLFLWMPPMYMKFIYTPQTHYIIGERKIRVDLSDYAHGTEWVKCGPK